MTFTTDRSMRAATKAFIAKTLPKVDWTHEAHFAVALCLLADDKRDAFSDMPPLIRAYNEATGVPNTDHDGYHETITMACLRGARAHLERAERPMPLNLVLEALMASALGRSDWLLSYWSRPLLFSPTARRSWVAPDLRPLPF